MLKLRNIVLAIAALTLGTGVMIASAVSVSMTDTADGATEVQLRVDGNQRRNILVLGTDDEAGLCDVMMLASLDLDGGNATVVQLPRDTYAAYTAASYKKLNGAYSSLGGARATADFLESAMGLEIDNYVCMDLDTLGRIVNAVGGVDVNVPRDMYYNDPEQGLSINIKKGMNHLNGDTAQDFVRYRAGYADGDLGRIDAQKLFVAALFTKISESFSPVLVAKLAVVLKDVEMDMSIPSLLSLGEKILKLKGENITLLTLPGEQAIATQSGASYYVISRDACADVARKYLGGEGTFDPDGRFRNGDYDSFVKIYEGRTEYKAVTLQELAT